MGQDDARAHGDVSVWVIEDDEALAAALAFALEVEGFRVVTFHTGAQAQRATEAPPYCLIVDQGLPDTNGLRLVGALRAMGNAAPAILITTNPSLDVQWQAHAAGMHIVEKPLLGEELVQAVRMIGCDCARSRRTAAPSDENASSSEAAMHVQDVHSCLSAYIADIAVPMFRVSEDEAALAGAESLCDAGVRISACHIALMPNEVFAAAPEAADFWVDVITVSREERAREGEAIAARLARSSAKTALQRLELQSSSGFRTIVQRMRCADVIVMRRPERGADPRRKIFEALLFGAGRPILLAPPEWTSGLRAQRVLLAWNGTRESARAVADAMPWLRSAAQVEIGVVDPDPAQAADAAALREHLALHRVSANVRHMESAGQSQGAAILNEARAVNAQMLVMGGFGHARAMQMVFGGVTQHVLEHAHLPVLFSH